MKSSAKRTIVVTVAGAILGALLSRTIIWLRDKTYPAPTASASESTAISDSGVDMVDMTVPSGDTSFKAYMDWECITNKESTQYVMQQSAYTDSKGLRHYKDGRYMVAMGSYYGKVGDKFEITLDTGVTFDCIMGDIKADIHTDKSNRYTLVDDDIKNVVEFIVDVDSLDETVRLMGDVSYCGFEGDVDSIYRYNEE